MRLFRSLFIGLTVLFAASCGENPSRQLEPGEPDPGQSVWSVDLIRTLPGQQGEYLHSIEANWAGARKIALDQDAILSYRALVAEPDSLRNWDVLLMTEYSDSTAWNQREEIFASIFASPDYTAVPTSKPSSELRAFESTGIVMKTLAEGSRSSK
jgi:hypothetical protein